MAATHRGGGDFHVRGNINKSIARIAGHGGFWHVVETVMKRPTVNPNLFKLKLKITTIITTKRHCLTMMMGC